MQQRGPAWRGRRTRRRKGIFPHHVAVLGCCTCPPTSFQIRGAQPPVGGGRLGAGLSCGQRTAGAQEPSWDIFCFLGGGLAPVSTCASTHMRTQTCSFRKYLLSTLPQSSLQVLGIQQRKQNKTKQQSLPSEHLHSWQKDGNEKGDTTWSCTVHYLNSCPQATNFTLLSAQNLLQTLQRLKALTNSPGLTPSSS